MLAALLALALAFSPVQLRGTATEVDLDAVHRGVWARLGNRADGWSVAIDDAGPSRVRLTLSPPSGPIFVRHIELAGEDDQARSRQIAAELTLLIEQHLAPAPPTPASVVAPNEMPRGFLAAGVGLGGNFARTPALDARLGLAGGGYLLGQHLSPWASLDWSRSSARPLVVDAVRIHVGLAAGAPMKRDRLWLGGSLRGGTAIAWARERGRDAAVAATIAAAAVAHLRWRALFGAIEIGPELTLPPLRFVGSSTSLRWDSVRFTVSLRLGFLFRS